MMEGINVPELVERLGSDEDAARKMAAFKLQGNIGDPSFADIFIFEGGLGKLRYLTLHASGNTLAYSLTSLARLLEVDKGWEFIDQTMVERVGSNALWECIKIRTNGVSPDCRAYCHPSSREYLARSNVDSRVDCIASI